MQTLTGDTCANVDADGETAMALILPLPKRSHLLISFTFEWGGLDTGQEGLLSFTVDGGSTDSSAEWGFCGHCDYSDEGSVLICLQNPDWH
jgi:hypothetical protein